MIQPSSVRFFLGSSDPLTILWYANPGPFAYMSWVYAFLSNGGSSLESANPGYFEPFEYFVSINKVIECCEDKILFEMFMRSK